jgi:hypothetical protein
MVGQIASLLTGFTQAQDERLTSAISVAQQDNEDGLSELVVQDEAFDRKLADMSTRAQQYVEDMATVKTAGMEHAEQAQKVGGSLSGSYRR